jgi:adenine phosphoribosyltransferase
VRGEQANQRFGLVFSHIALDYYSTVQVGLTTVCSFIQVTMNPTNETNSSEQAVLNNKYQQDGQDARAIAKHLPYFPFKGIPRFYDIGGFLAKPDIFQRIVDIFVERYENIAIDSIAGLDARGFILGPPIALALKKPFLMMRKKGKMPNTLHSQDYRTEYGNREGLTVQRDKIHKGDRVLIVDDLVATGGTLSSAISLVKMLQGIVIECACVVELKMFINPHPDSGIPSRTKLFQELGHDHVPVWGLISEDVLLEEAPLPEDYVDDGEEH